MLLAVLMFATAQSLSPRVERVVAVGHRAPLSRRDVGWLSLAGVGASLVVPEEARAAVTTTLPSGIKVEDVVAGVGQQPTAESTITMDFTARLGGFDAAPYVQTPKTGVKVDLTSDAIAPGLKEAILAGSAVGGVRRVVVPPAVGYGASGFPREDGTAAGAKGSIVPPDSTLYYEFKIRSITLSKGLGFGLNFF